MDDRRGLGPYVAPLFVLLWSTGFVGAKYGLPYAEPMTFLTIRFALAAACLGLWAVATGAFRDLADARGAAVVGALIHGAYLGGVFTAIWRGGDAGLVALIVGLQPVATALMARGMLGEMLTARQWGGMALGLGGVALVVSGRLAEGRIDAVGVALCGLALTAISFASILQKRRDVQTAFAADNAVQFAAAAVVAGLAALLFETGRVQWTAEFVAALGWMTGALSIGAISILYFLLRCGGASSVASLFFLVPGVTALLAWAMFGETFGAMGIAGLLAATAGVYLVTSAIRPAQRTAASSA